MSSRRCFKAKKAVKVVSYKDGKVNRRSKLTVPVKYSEPAKEILSSPSASNQQYAVDSPQGVSFGDDVVGETVKVRPKRGKLRLKKKIMAYRNKKIKLSNAWLDIRQQLLSTAVELQAFPPEQRCVMPSCKEEACGRCLDCGPAHFMCDEHINMIHAGFHFHNPEIWKVYSLYSVEHSVQCEKKIVLYHSNYIKMP
jgi:hypothetical protein